MAKERNERDADKFLDSNETFRPTRDGLKIERMNCHKHRSDEDYFKDNY